MTYKGNPSGFRSTKQAEAIANMLDYMSVSDAYDENAQSRAKQLASSIRRYIKGGIILTNRLTYSTEAESILSEAFDIYIEAKHGGSDAED